MEKINGLTREDLVKQIKKYEEGAFDRTISPTKRREYTNLWHQFKNELKKLDEANNGHHRN